MDRHPQNKVQDELYSKIVQDLKEMNDNIARMNELLSNANKTNETAVLVSQLNGVYNESVSFQLGLQKKWIL